MSDWDGAGNFTGLHNWEDDLTNGIKIKADRHKAQDDVFISGINACMTKSGENAATGNMDLGSNKITNVADGTSANDAVNMGQAQEQSGVYYTSTGSSNAYVLTPSPAITSYIAGQRFAMKANFSNTGASTINISGLGAKSLVKSTNQALASGDVPTNSIKEIIYDGTNFQVINIDSSHTVKAVTFDGTNDYLTRGADLTGSVDSKLFTISFWVRRTSIAAGIEGVYGFDNNGRVSIDSSDQIHIILRDGAASSMISGTSTTTITDTNWHHVCFSVDLDDSTSGQLYIDDTLDATTFTPLGTNAINFTVTDHAVGDLAGAAGASALNADMSDLWIGNGMYVDFRAIANRRKFIDGSLKPADLLLDGSAPTGAIPIMYFSGATASWHTNKGSGGGFTENGALTDASSSPSD